MQQHLLASAEIEEYANLVTQQEPDTAAAIADKTRNTLQYTEMLTGKVEGRFLSMLIGLTGAHRVLEVGMFTGYSAYMMARALPEDGEVVTLEMNERYKAIADDCLKDDPHAKKIKVVMGNALETIPKLQGPFDMMFLDADKEHYPEYYELMFPKLKTGGLFVVDNALWYGEVTDPKDRKAEAIDKLNHTIKNDPRVENVLLTVRDGIHLARKTGDDHGTG